ncbi:hypothetical protein LTR17_025375 [Elasticomyces elasticus]|nr:hypothetical protein LTR17_025375 [Elasticomyces elasticus]
MAHALILGASGISGWSLLNQTRVYPTTSTFRRITGTTNRPLTLEQAQIPQDDRVRLVCGINFLEAVNDIAAGLRAKIADVDTVTHVFFTAYIQEDDHHALKETNTRLLDNAIRAVEMVAPSLTSVILQTGGKGYGLEFPKEVGIHPPLAETCPRIPEPWASRIFYYNQYDLLTQLSAGKSWTFSEVRPDGIVGFAPGSNAMNMAQGMAIYLSTFKKVHGPGATVPFPGSEHGYHSTHSDTFQDILSRMEIFAAIHHDKCGNGGVFNVADGQVVTWAEVWPKLCSHFGLVGGGPRPGSTSIHDFVEAHRSAWEELAAEHGIKASLIDEQGWGHLEFMMVDFDFDRQYDLSRSRAVGFLEQIETVDGYVRSWERMRAARLIPPV